MARRMRDRTFRDEQWRRRHEPHVAALNRQLESWAQDRQVAEPPLVPPHLGGIKARIVCVLRDPGPRAGGVKGSRFVSWENDDPTAERHQAFANQAGISDGEVVTFNSYLWYINAQPTKTQLVSGIPEFLTLLGLVDRPEVIIFHGRTAHYFRRLLDQAQPAWSPVPSSTPGKWDSYAPFRSGDHILETYHPSRQALQSPDPAERERREAHLRRTYQHAATLIRSSVTLPADDPSR